MKNITRTKIYGSGILALTTIFSAGIAYAQCPVCTVAVIGGVGFTRWLKIDDTVSGLWIGAFLVAITLWTINWLDGKKIRFFGRKPLIAALYYYLTIAPMYWTNFIGHPLNKVFGQEGIDKLVFGIICGTVLYFLSHSAYQYLKKKNGGHAHFPYEKIVFAVVPMTILSVIFFFIFKPIN